MIATILYAWLMVCGFMFLVWGYYLYTKNPGVIDVGWSLGFLIAGSFFLFHQQVTWYTLIFFSILLTWGLRLGGYLYLTRVKPKHIEQRYVKISNNWKMKKSLGFFINFQFQGLLIVVIALPLLFIGLSQTASMSLLDYTALFLVAFGITGESIADWQLYSYKKKKIGKLCDSGLWRYSRHPNYFFEWLVWVGFTLSALGQPYGFLSIISPALLFSIMIFLTGPITERSSIDSRGDLYREYQRKTSMFFPWWSKK